jgi:hypothetical protein
VAPTQKISDDSPFAPIAGAAPRVIHATPAPPSAAAAPPPAAPDRTGAAPPGARRSPSPPVDRRPGLDDAGASMPIVARRPWGLITAVLVVDLGLAAAGAWMLSAGLGARAAPPPAPSGARVTPIEPAGGSASAPPPRSSP